MSPTDQLKKNNLDLVHLTDKELTEIRDECRIFAEIIFEQWLDEMRDHPAERQSRTETNLVSDIGSGRKESHSRPGSISATECDHEQQ